MAVRRVAYLAMWSCACWAAPQPGTKEASGAPQRLPPALEVAETRELCTPLWGGLSSECMAALDGIYLHRDVTRNRHSEPLRDPAVGDERRPWHPLPVEDRIVWHDVFSRPMELRHAVEDAMADSRCLATSSDALHGLREACAADAFARLSVLHRACGRILYWDGSEHHDGWAAEWALERQALAEDAAPELYGQRLARLDESELHFAWRVAKCRVVPRESVARVIGLQVPHYRLGIQATELLVVAARLGSVWANTRVGGDGVELNAVARQNLALAYLRRAFGAAHDSPRMYLPYLLAARAYDLRTDAQLDWSELDQRFSKAALERAQPTLTHLLRQGWRPMEERSSADATWPWAMAPPVVDTQRIRQRLDQSGTMRWMYESGTEEWLDADGVNRVLRPDGSELTVYHGPLRDRQRPHLRSWLDEDGRRRWLDVNGVEHWIDADGIEHWVDFGGTEWILLPPESSPSIPRQK